jgi:exodeoxyribonuclease V beta subunit
VITVDPGSGARTFDVSGGSAWPTKKEGEERKVRAEQEMTGERLRLLYVALTRSRHHTAVWWANGGAAAKTALARVLFARYESGAIDPEQFMGKTVPIPGSDTIEATFAPMKDGSPGAFEVVSIDAGPVVNRPWAPAAAGEDRPDLETHPFDVWLDRSRHRWSFSAITQYAAADSVDPSDPSDTDAGAGDERWWGSTADDDRPGGGPEGLAPTGRAGPVSPLAWLPAGTAFGTLVHSVLEEIDFAAADVRDQVAAEVDRQLAWRSLELTPVTGAPVGLDGRRLLTDGILAALDTPLGPTCPGLSLRQVTADDRLNELTFDLRLGGAGRHPSVRDIGRLLLDHLSPVDPLRRWASRVADGAIEVQLAGHLTGSIDLVLRHRDGAGTERYVVADYKTNQLTPRGHMPGSDEYRTDRMAEAMAEHDYPLQAVLYAVALHRYLRWRLPGQDPGVHLGGIAYLFLRGMSGGDVAVTEGQPGGVFGWDVPAACVESLSDLLDGRLSVERAS